METLFLDRYTAGFDRHHTISGKTMKSLAKQLALYDSKDKPPLPN